MSVRPGPLSCVGEGPELAVPQQFAVRVVHRRAGGYASAATRLDARRIRLPRLPPAEQREYGLRFAAVAAVEESLRLAARLGGQLVRGLHDGLTDPALPPS